MKEIHNPRQKIAVVTQNTPNLINEYYKEVRQNHIMYCNKHNYTYYVFYENLAEHTVKGESPKICWSKVKACLNVVRNHEYIMWIDADAIFANQEITIEDRIKAHPNKEYYLCKDPKSHFINSGVMIWKNSVKAIAMLDKWWAMEHLSYGKGGDQAPLGSYLKQHKEHDDEWHHYEEREMNCYPTNYHPYDYIIHYMGGKSKIHIKERINNWNNYIKYENERPKIYVSLAIIPSRINSIHKLIDNLLIESTVKPDKIVITMPKSYKLFDSDSKHIEDVSRILCDYIRSDKVYVNVINEDFDFGPSNKWIGMFDYASQNLKNENYVFVVVDDDLLILQTYDRGFIVQTS